mgnify:FL=1|tara:strand:+ start:2000 stop:2398 length:399 start_codon:yes stop_codon:yes gene_type:complete
MTTAITVEKHNHDMMIVQATLLADASGDASIQTSNEYKGFIVKIKVDPTTGSTAPTANWDLYVTDDYLTGTDGTVPDVLGLVGKDRHTTSIQSLEQDDLHNGAACHGKLTIVGDAMGNGGDATVTLYILRVV